MNPRAYSSAIQWQAKAAAKPAAQKPSRAYRDVERRRPIFTRPPGLGILVVLVLCVSACSKPSPEARLEQVGSALDSVSSDLAGANKQVRQLETQLAKERKRRRKLVEEKLTLEERLKRRATDVALFRAVQSKLLNSERLKDSAITVAAHSRTITLEGLVASDKKAETAVSIAKSVAGVTEVDSRLEVDAPEGESDQGKEVAGA